MGLSILNYQVYDGDINSISLINKYIINTINPHSYVVAKGDLGFREALKNSDILLPDGIGIVYAARYLKGKDINRVTGFDIFITLMKKLNKDSKTCFFLGASELTLSLIKTKISKEYPNVKVGTFSPPYKDSFSEDENIKMIKEIKKVNPDVLFVGMTAPKQEKWVYANKEKLNVDIICSIGAVFDFYAGTFKRSNKIWITLGLEWLPRLIRNPKRLWKRTFISAPIFLKDMFFFKIKGSR